MLNSQENQFISLTEKFNADKLAFIVNNFDDLKNQLRKSCFEDESYDPLNMAKKYLNRSRNGVISVDYKQNNGIGRFCSIGSMSLQNLVREIRHTISDGYYVDVDMKNAHPVILSYLCHKNGFDCKYLDEYIKNREQHLKDLNISRENAKQVYLALTNGGDKDYHKVENKTEHLRNYRDEMLKLHSLFSRLYPEDFKRCKEKRIKNNKDYNHNAGFMNILMCDMENKILMVMYEYFGKPKNAVLCFDGIMLEKGKEYNIQGCEKYITKKIGIDMKLSIKPFDEGLNLPEEIPKHIDFRLDYYTDFRNLLKQKVIYPEWVNEWVNNSLVLIENDGKQFYLTRNKRVIVFGDNTKEIRDEWKPVPCFEIEKNLKVKCDILNPFYDYVFHQKYKKMKPKEKKEISKEMVERKTKKYSYGTLGLTNSRHGEGFLTYIMETRTIRSYNNIDFYPYLKEKGTPPFEDTFNRFTDYPLEGIENKENINFLESKLYQHFKNDFFNNDEGELNHFLDHIADLIQDPAQIKGTSHLFYSKQGCGKGLLFKFMTKLLGVANVISIINTDTYFDKNFNSDVSNKLLKVFEEVSEKGSAFKNHNRLKGEITADQERVEPKGIDPYYQRHCARFWFFTNNENALYVENDDRRHTLHKISDRHRNNYEYFAPIWNEIKNENFLKCAYNFFKDRKYEERNVMNAYTTQYKKDQKNSNLPKGIKFILNFVERDFEKIEDKTIKITSAYLKHKFRVYCENQGTKYQLSTFHTQIRKIGIDPPKQLNIREKNGVSTKKYCYKINTYKLQEEMRRFLTDDEYCLSVKNNIEQEEADEEDVRGFDNDEYYRY
jgi:hypothetical protein